MNTQREVLVLDPALVEEVQKGCASDFACALTDEEAVWLEDVSSLADESRSFPARWPGRERAGHSWETLAYATLGACGLASLVLCFY